MLSTNYILSLQIADFRLYLISDLLQLLKSCDILFEIQYITVNNLSEFKNLYKTKPII